MPLTQNPCLGQPADTRAILPAMSRPLPLVLALALTAGCGPTASAPGDGGTDAPRPDAPRPPVDAGAEMLIAGGEASGDWCGNLHVTANVTVPAGSTLTVCAGSFVSFDAGVGITVVGTLVLAGTVAGGPITLGPATAGGMWSGLSIDGTLDGDFVELSRATVGVSGGDASDIRLGESSLTDCGAGFSLDNGGTFERVTILHGTTNLVHGGLLVMTDSVVDFDHAGVSPDCIDWRAGGGTLDHVRVSDCHCPLHIAGATEEITVTNSILDGAANAVMLASVTAEFHGNHFEGVSTLMLDIGGDIDANVSGNYWGGDAPDIGSVRLDQFIGADVFSTTPIAGVGPR